MNRNEIFSQVSRYVGVSPIRSPVGYTTHVPFYDRLDGPIIEISASSYPMIMSKIRATKARIALKMIAENEGFELNDESYETLELRVEYGHAATDWRSIVRHVANQNKNKLSA